MLDPLGQQEILFEAGESLIPPMGEGNIGGVVEKMFSLNPVAYEAYRRSLPWCGRVGPW